MRVVATGPFDNLRSADVRFLQECSKAGELVVLAWDDESTRRLTGKAPKFPISERLYFLQALRYVSEALPIQQHSVDALELHLASGVKMWMDTQETATAAREAFCRSRGLEYRILGRGETAGFPVLDFKEAPKPKKVLVTGCYDWLHSGHIRFFEEVNGYGNLYVVVGNDANIRTLKGPGHPLQPQEERRYMVGSIRYVSGALVASGTGWLDAAPEIERLRPDIYAVNEDGDKGGKREFCAEHGLEYLILRRVPAPGLPKRSSTELRGF